MDRLFVALIIAVASCGAGAREWVDVFRNENMIVYVDKASITRTGNIVKAWKLVDFKAPKKLKGKSYLSSQTATEFDCIDKQSRTYYWSIHANRMASGGLAGVVGWCCADGPISQWPGSVWESAPPAWEEVFAPVDDAVWQFVCRSK